MNEIIEAFRTWHNDQTKYKILCIGLAIALIYYEINIDNEIETFKKGFTFYNCYGTSPEDDVKVFRETINTSFINTTDYLNVSVIK